eukprot:scaffold34815_cov63-Phaeocystis_antarctica.AAC.9
MVLLSAEAARESCTSAPGGGRAAAPCSFAMLGASSPCSEGGPCRAGCFELAGFCGLEMGEIGSHRSEMGSNGACGGTSPRAACSVAVGGRSAVASRGVAVRESSGAHPSADLAHLAATDRAEITELRAAGAAGSNGACGGACPRSSQDALRASCSVALRGLTNPAGGRSTVAPRGLALRGVAARRLSTNGTTATRSCMALSCRSCTCLSCSLPLPLPAVLSTSALSTSARARSLFLRFRPRSASLRIMPRK